MNLQAHSIGALIKPERISGAVHSVFQNACNLRLKTGEIVVLLVRENLNVPHGIRLNTPQGFSFEAILPVDAAMHIRAGVLRFETSSPFALDLRTANIWHCPIGALGANMAELSNLTAWHNATDCFQHHDKQTGLDGFAFWPDLRAAIFQVEAKQTASLLNPLIGRGPGLTPSGDDFIVGLLAGLWAQASHDPKRTRYITVLGKSLEKYLPKTSDISAAYLSAACQGEVSESLSILSCALARGANAATLKSAMDQALAVGHTSGADGVAGLLAGLSAWCSGLEMHEPLKLRQNRQEKMRAA